MQSGYDDSQTRNSLITTRKTICLLDSEGRTIFAVPYQPGYVDYPQVQISFLQPTDDSTANFAVWFHPDIEMNRKADGKMPIHVLWLGPGQAVAKSADLPSLPVLDFTRWPDKLAEALLPPPAHLMLDKNLYSPWNVLSFALAVMSAVQLVADAPLRFVANGGRRLDALRFSARHWRAAHSAVRSGMAGARGLSPLQKTPRR